MEFLAEFVQTVQDIVLKPDLSNAFIVFIISFLNEIPAIFPYNVVLSGQVFFLEGGVDLQIFTNLFFYLAVPIALGTSLASLATYGLAYFGGKPAIERFGKYVRLSWTSVEKLTSKFSGLWYDEIIFLALRSVPFFPAIPINVAAGILRMRFLPYLVLTFAGTVIKVVIMILFIGVGVNGVENLMR